VEGQLDYAALLFGTASALRDELAAPVPHSSRVTYEHSVAETRRSLSDPVFSAAWARGRLLTPDQALALRPASTKRELKESLPLVPAFAGNLTPREGEVLRLVARGMTSAQIADRLVVSTFTVNAHLRSIYGKIDVSSRSAATRFALEHGMR
jgi:DNA-binding NarL/FixJ family response regulator